MAIKSQMFKLIILIALLLGVFLFSPSATLASTGDQLYIKVKSTRLRASPQHWAPGIASLNLGNAVQEINSEGAWLKVRTQSGQQGYLHESAISDKKIVLRTSGKGSSQSTSSEDVVMAGKGFNKQVEQQFALQNPSASFAEVNRMESIKVQESELLSFIKSGGLKSDA